MKGIKPLVLFSIGAAGYTGVEYLWRALTGQLPVHWTMALLGGLMFLLIGEINEGLSWNMPLMLQGVIGAAIVTAAELLAGVFLNLLLGLNIWDYSDLPFNLWGQICLPFSLAWIGLSILAVMADDWLRYLLWNEERPNYTFLTWGRISKKTELQPGRALR
jgi:hypothetical protein